MLLRLPATRGGGVVLLLVIGFRCGLAVQVLFCGYHCRRKGVGGGGGGLSKGRIRALHIDCSRVFDSTRFDAKCEDIRQFLLRGQRCRSEQSAACAGNGNVAPSRCSFPCLKSACSPSPILDALIGIRQQLAVRAHEIESHLAQFQAGWRRLATATENRNKLHQTRGFVVPGGGFPCSVLAPPHFRGK